MKLALAAHLGTRHIQFTVTPKDALEVILRLPAMYDEPFADSSQISTSLVCSFRRREATMALTGNAGNELFGGYSRCLEIAERWCRLHAPSGKLIRVRVRALARAAVCLPRSAIAPLVPPASPALGRLPA